MYTENPLSKASAEYDYYLRLMISEVVRAELSMLKDSFQFNKVSYSKAEFAKAIKRSESFVDKQRRKGVIKKWKQNGAGIEIHHSELENFIFTE